jgi:hypothetical protein
MQAANTHARTTLLPPFVRTPLNALAAMMVTCSTGILHKYANALQSSEMKSAAMKPGATSYAETIYLEKIFRGCSSPW